MKRILIMGLPGSGKTTLARELSLQLDTSFYDVQWLNADEIRKRYNDWNFSLEGRLRQAQRMRTLSDESDSRYVIADFVCPLQKMREIYEPDWVIWMDTIDQSRYQNTDAIFEKPSQYTYDFRISEMDAKKWAPKIAHAITNNIRPKFDWTKPTVQMLGRWQPWHPGHHALFERAIAKTGQVIIMVRDCHDKNNPFSFSEVEDRIRRDLDGEYNGRYVIRLVPNIVNITYGRDVGYKIEQETFDESITSISATKIRKEMGLC
jgi:adenylylsulfate kinase